MTWVHWVLYNLPPDATGLAEGMTAPQLPKGAQEGINDWRRTGYGGRVRPSDVIAISTNSTPWIRHWKD